jgi:synaptic vesicle membrane protein VAT-1
MKKVVIHSAGGYDKLKIESFADLEPDSDEVIVHIYAFGVNYADCLVRYGVYESAKEYVGWPITPGFEFSGIVHKVGSSVSELVIGQSVMGISLFNAYATQVKVKPWQLFQIPQGFSMTEAAGFPAVFLTAYHALFQLVKIYPTSHILVHSAAGGVGSALVQLAKAAEITVTGVVGSSQKIESLKKFGADCVIDKSTHDLWQEAEKISPEGFDAIFDANGYTTLMDGYRHLKPVGKLISYGSHSLLPKGGSGRINYIKAFIGLLRTPKFSPLNLITHNKSIVGFNLSFLFSRQDLVQEAMTHLLELVATKKIKAPLISKFNFNDIASAHATLESAQTVGKIVITTD